MTTFPQFIDDLLLQTLARVPLLCHVKKRPVKRYQRFNWPVTNGYEGAC